MEDASKEFQIFLSPTREHQMPYRESTASKHRIVPVINKFLSSSSATNFTLNQRKSSVYKAVSGVSFQDADVLDAKPTSKKEKREKRRERRQTCVAPFVDIEKIHCGVPPTPGARRSRSLTSVESAATDLSKNPPEITHPFAPVILYNNQNSGRKSRYARVKEKRRSSSQVRNAIDLKKPEFSSQKNEQQPVRPRRARSASRTRKPLPLTPFQSDTSNFDTSSSGKDDSLYSRREEKIKSRRKDESEMTIKSKESVDESTKLRDKRRQEDIDFSVNDNDWKKYDAIVTQKLDTLLKKKEEPEGGYFSLEREDAEDLERSSETGDHFQRDNSSETIYIAQVFSNDSKVSEVPNIDQYTVEEIYSEVPFSNQSQEVGYEEDEGLYEEIFFDKNDERVPTLYNNDNYGENLAVNILVASNGAANNATTPQAAEINEKKIEKSSSTTVVYIGGKNEKNEIEYFEKSPYDVRQSSSCNNLTYRLEDKSSLNRILSTVDKVNPSGSKEDKKQVKTSAWCGCYTRPNFQAKHTSSCIRSASGLLSKYSFVGDTQEENNRNISVNKNATKCNNKTITPSSVLTTRTYCKNSDKFPEPDYELSDIDLDMFAPKPTGDKSRSHAKDHMLRSVSEMRLNSQQFQSWLPQTMTKLSYDAEIISPQTFRGFLEDSLFNPPDTDSVSDHTTDLVIRDDQTVACITDSDSTSSSETDSDEEPLQSKEGDKGMNSLWLEAENEFEFVTFKEKKDEKSKFLKLGRRKKSRKGISLPKLFGGGSTTHSSSSDATVNSRSISSSSRFLQNERETPKRPRRRRDTLDAGGGGGGGGGEGGGGAMFDFEGNQSH